MQNPPIAASFFTEYGEIAEELLVLYLEESQACMEKLDDPEIFGNADLIRKTAHKLKGSSACVHATQMVKLADTLEREALEIEIKNLHSHIQSMNTHYVQIKNYLRAEHNIG